MYKRRLAILLLVLLLVMATLAVTPALGAPGGKGGGEKALPATLSVTPNPVSAWGAQYAVAGSGFNASTPVNLVLSEPFCCSFFTVAADANGNIWIRSTTGQPGTYKIDAYQRPNGKRLTLMATTSFSVVEP